MKFSVAPESIRATASALFDFDVTIGTNFHFPPSYGLPGIPKIPENPEDY